MYVIHLTFVHNFTLFKMNIILKRCDFRYTFFPLFYYILGIPQS